MRNRYSLGYFINYNIWEQAIKLLNLQIEERNKDGIILNNKLNFKYFARIRTQYEGIIDSNDYFEQRIKNNLFYGLSNEFFTYEYGKSKKNFGIRNYFFISYPLVTVHYSIGIYLLMLSQEFIDRIRFSHKNNSKYKIKSYYGGDLRIKKKALLFDNSYKRLFYKEHYDNFKDDIKKETEKSQNKVILKIDIENYYDNISVKKLCYFLNKYIDSISQQKLKFDEYTIDQICFFYEFIMRDKLGIPQSDNNIISDFIGYLYLLFADMTISDEIRDEKIEYSKVIRYVDDIYIIIKYKDNLDEYEKLRENSMNILFQISDLLYYKFGLKINSKTRVLLVDNKDEKEELLNELKKTSAAEYIPEIKIENDKKKNKKNKIKPQERLEEILDEVKKMKENDFIYNYFNTKGEILDTEKLKDVYDKGVLNILNSDSYIKIIGEIFNDFNFNLLRFSTNELILLILKNECSKEKLINFFISKKENITINDRDVILEILNKLDYKDNRLIELLMNNKNFKKIIEEAKSGQACIEYPGYYNLSIKGLSKIYERDSILQQIELRALYERKNSYSVALNHLVNEFHSICFYLDDYENKDHNKYTAADVDNFLNNKVTFDSKNSIQNLFKRRNNNDVSHPGTDELLSQGVTKEEYKKYKKVVGKCLNEILGEESLALVEL